MLTHYLKRLAEHTPFENLTGPLQQLAAWPRRRSPPALQGLREEQKLLAAAYRLLMLPQSSAVCVGGELASLLPLAPQGRHVAFEPEPQRARRLRRRFPGLDVRETALLGEALRPLIQDSSEEPDPAPDALDVLAAIRGEGRSLDALIGEQPVDLLRLEAEGAELFVMMGAERLLARCRPSLVFGSRLPALQRWELRPEDVFDYLSGLGYRVFLPRAFATHGSPLSRAEFCEAHAAPLLASAFVATAPERVCGRRLVQRSARPTARVPLAGQANLS